ncbi:uncharacterized protein LOC126825711 [Patella vulgata]|uniref:uncharacterized protein LOC126825711 n=1 Tax=Patella vulgata TaxID=6465 RepID=UPI00218083A8|nr:uncharacterized protein LOC126825711 [Patella vulgata]XP_050411429.1 uncharacterized protein LOC126825711 [Patella vulgata]
MFNNADLLPDYRTEKVESIINKMADRVVQVKGPSVNGSGIIFKANNKFYLQTCVHVIIAFCPEHNQNKVPQGTPCQHCDYEAYVVKNVGVEYKDRFGEEGHIDREKIKLVAMCESSEKAIFSLDEVPKFIQENDMKDLRWLVVDIQINGNQTNTIKGLLEVHKTASRDPTFIIRSAKPIAEGTECCIVFNNTQETRCTGIEKCCNYCSWLFFDQTILPTKAKDYFFKGLPWETNGEQQVVVIAYAEDKEIRFGKPLPDPDHQDCLIPCEGISPPKGIAPLKKVVFLKHDASVKDGNSGGCVFVIGKDTKASIGYKSYMCMHIAGNDDHGLSSIGLIN